MNESPIHLNIESYRECVPVRSEKANWVLVDLSVPAQAQLGEMHGEMVLVLDKSGSMFYSKSGESRPVDQVVTATRAVIDALRPVDRLGIVSFEDNGELVCPLTPGEAKQRLHDSLHGITDRPGGATYMRSGLETAMREVRMNAKDPRAVRLVVLTDGQATDASETLAYVRTLERQSIAAMGCGEFDFDFMNKVCAPSNGLCEELDVSDAGKISEVFLSELNVAQNTAATNIRLQIEPSDFVRLRKAYVVHPHPTFLGEVEMGTRRHYSVDLSILDRTEGIQLVFDLMHTPRDPGPCDAARITVRYDVPSLDLKDQSVEQVFQVEYTDNERDLLRVNQNVKLARDRGYDEELRLKWEEASKHGHIEEANQILDTMRKSSNTVVAEIVTTIRKGGKVTSQELQEKTRRKTLREN